jgi:gamma-glutamylcyclotransferase (GGCT)/AIG2-like uncharacterized protein YtfP
VTRLFVYGSLLPDQANWYVLAPFVTGDGVADTVPGELFDTGHGWPAAVFGATTRRVVGMVFELRRELAREALALLDRFEDVDTGKYARIEVITDAGVSAWTYHALGSPRLDRIVSGDWSAHIAGR